jgi:hypothetical protein
MKKKKKKKKKKRKEREEEDLFEFLDPPDSTSIRYKSSS